MTAGSDRRQCFARAHLGGLAVWIRACLAWTKRHRGSTTLCDAQQALELLERNWRVAHNVHSVKSLGSTAKPGLNFGTTLGPPRRGVKSAGPPSENFEGGGGL